MKKLLTIIYYLLTTLVAPAFAQPQLSADTILLGDQTVLRVSGEECGKWHPEGDGAIEVLKEEYDTLHKAMLTTLTCFEPGLHYVKLGPDDSLPLMVLDIEVDTSSEEIRDIAGIEQVPYTFWEIIRWVLLGLGMLALAFGGWWFWKKWKSGKVSEWLSDEKPDTRTAEERALDNLETLRKKQLWQSGRTKEYYTELTDTVRLFIEETTEIRATEMTSEECVNALMCKSVSDDATALLRKIFSTADMVKFAKSEPLPYEHQKALEGAMEFVQKMWACVNRNNGDNENDGNNE